MEDILAWIITSVIGFAVGFWVARITRRGR